MENNGNNIPLNLYNEQLTIINGIKFTHREIDIITSIIHMRGASKIASLLSISTRTVETHTANIMRKMDANSREGIIDFVERAGHAPWINKHYQNLLIQTEFKKLLHQILRLTQNKSLACSIIYDHEQGENAYFLSMLKEHLSLCGIKIALHEISKEQSIAHSLLDEKYPLQPHIIYVIPQRFIEQFQINKQKQISEISDLVQKNLPNYSSLTFLLYDKGNAEIPQDFLDIGYIGFGEQQDYYSSLFNVLRRILPDINLDKNISEFKKTLENPWMSQRRVCSELAHPQEKIDKKRFS